MAVFKITGFAALTLAVAFLALRITTLFFRKKGNIGLLIGWTLAAALLAVFFAYCSMVANIELTWRTGTLSSACYIAASADFVSSLLSLVFCGFKSKKNDSNRMERAAELRTRLGVCSVIILLLYGMVNMEVILPHYLTIGSDKLSQNHTFVMVSDIHYGSPQPEAVIDRMLEKIKKEDPEFIVLNGDITDEYTTKDELEAIYSKFGALDIPTYFVYGNHERQPDAEFAHGRTYTDEELRSCIEANGIVILKDELVLIGDDISLLGREDVSCHERLTPAQLPARDPGRYQICADHQPYNYDDIIAQKADLQISGHSHAGQLFPLNFLYNSAGFCSCGEYTLGDTLLYVGVGAGGWNVPYRTEKHSYFDVITLSAD